MELALGGLSFVPFAILLGLLILAVFAWWELSVERRGGTPIVSMGIFRNRTFVAGASVTGTMMLAQNGIIFSLPVFLQSVRNLDAFHTGLTLLPMPVLLFVVSPSAAMLSKKVPAKRLVQAGLIVNVVALLVLHWTLGVDTPLVYLIPGLALYGIGLGLVLSQINNLTLSSVAVEEAGEASGITNTFRQIGSALGAAILGAVLLTSIVGNLEEAVTANPRIPASAKPQIEGTLRRQASNLAFGGAELFERLPPASRQEMSEARRAATVEGNRKALLYGAGFVLLGLLISTRLPLRAADVTR
jgi:Na+/melibiose symporter-like transporter